jgi:tRNA(fMet)-specific endonuclease VapC
MLILDTDHMSQLHRGIRPSLELRVRLDATALPFGTTIVSVEELWRGRLAQVAGNKDGQELILPYDRLSRLNEALANWLVLRWDGTAASTYEKLRSLRLGIGTMDLRIASIVLATNAILLSRNLNDFARVPDLKVEDWLS